MNYDDERQERIRSIWREVTPNNILEWATVVMVYFFALAMVVGIIRAAIKVIIGVS